MENTTRVLWVALSLIPRMGGRTLARLVDHFGSPEGILAARQDDLRAVRGIGPQMAAAIRAVNPEHTQAQMSAWEASGIALLVHGEAGYPAALAPLADAPPILFRRGESRAQDAAAVAIVGTRTPNTDSSRLAEMLAHTLAGRGWAVVSGLAAGIDAAAHRGALAAGGLTLAVLGCGVQVIYPPENRPLAGQILQRGALFSEVQPDAPPNSPALVARNRLITGLSRAVIVVETGETGGSLHAIRFAREQGRAVYAVQNEAAGNRRLIAEGEALPLAPDPHTWDRLFDALDTPDPTRP